MPDDLTPVYHITLNGRDRICGMEDGYGVAIHVTYAARELNRGEWCIHCQALYRVNPAKWLEKVDKHKEASDV